MSTTFFHPLAPSETIEYLWLYPQQLHIILSHLNTDLQTLRNSRLKDVEHTLQLDQLYIRYQGRSLYIQSHIPLNGGLDLPISSANLVSRPSSL